MREIFFAFILIVPLKVNAQNLDQNFVGAGGDYFENSNKSISWTIGELVIESLDNDDNFLTQGFQQGQLSIETIIDENEFTNEFKVYPNPVSSILHIETLNEVMEYQLLDFRGQIIIAGKTVDPVLKIDFSGLSPGLYLLKINDMPSHKIIKL